jgi:ADP-heptose:LPS heptosyltransferase
LFGIIIKSTRPRDESEPAEVGASSACAGAAGGPRRRLGFLRRNKTVRQIVRDIIERANRARDAGIYRDAAVLYEEATRIRPDNGAIHVQCGHMFKEAGDLANAEHHYLEADRLMPDDPDLALQLGHFYKVAGQLSRSEDAYRRALALKPDWAEPASELEQLTGGLNKAGADMNADPAVSAEMIARLAPELVPRKSSEFRQIFVDSIHLKGFEVRRERSVWGVLPTLRGVQAIRGFCISSAPIVDFEIAVDGQFIHKGPLHGHAIDGCAQGQRKYVFNIWHDFSGFTFGRCALELRFVDKNHRARSLRKPIVIAAPLSEAQHPDCDALISLRDGDLRSATEQINSRPSVVREPKRRLFAEPFRKVLVLRTDQLGDMVCSIPAIRRLKELLPGAHIVGLLTSASAEFARTLALFDEIIVADFPDDRAERRRVMPLDKQEQLRTRLEPYHFDLAIDLSVNAFSRPLLLLSGARFLYGFQDREWPWLSAGFAANTHDPVNRHEAVPASMRILGLVERLGAMLESRAEVVRRADITPQTLRPYGLTEGDRFAVLHAGARLPFSRWPYYPELASLLLERTTLNVVLLTDDLSMRDRLAPDLLDSGRFQLLDRHLPFDDLDALLSFCTVFVGNDSGPKHLAALRGVKVVSLHSARINWNEMGQEISGIIISRKVPCAGCGIDYDEDECGKDFACITKISPEEVFTSVMTLL